MSNEEIENGQRFAEERDRIIKKLFNYISNSSLPLTQEIVEGKEKETDIAIEQFVDFYYALLETYYDIYIEEKRSFAEEYKSNEVHDFCFSNSFLNTLYENQYEVYDCYCNKSQKLFCMKSKYASTIYKSHDEINWDLANNMPKNLRKTNKIWYVNDRRSGSLEYILRTIGRKRFFYLRQLLKQYFIQKLSETKNLYSILKSIFAINDTISNKTSCRNVKDWLHDELCFLLLGQKAINRNIEIKNKDYFLCNDLQIMALQNVISSSEKYIYENYVAIKEMYLGETNWKVYNVLYLPY